MYYILNYKRQCLSECVGHVIQTEMLAAAVLKLTRILLPFDINNRYLILNILSYSGG